MLQHYMYARNNKSLKTKLVIVTAGDGWMGGGPVKQFFSHIR